MFDGNYILITPLKKDEVLKRLSDNVEPQKYFRFWSVALGLTKQYEGTIWQNGFNVRRINLPRTNVRVLISGTFDECSNRLHINVKSKIPAFAWAIMFIWLGIIGSVCVEIIVSIFIHIKKIQQNGFPTVLLGPFFMFLFGGAFFMFLFQGFRAEIKESKIFFTDLFEATQMSSGEIEESAKR